MRLAVLLLSLLARPLAYGSNPSQAKLNKPGLCRTFSSFMFLLQYPTVALQTHNV